MRAEVREGAVSYRVAGDAGEQEGHLARLLVRGAPDREDQDRADHDVRDGVGQVQEPGARVRLIHLAQAERPGRAGQGNGHDESVEPHPPARGRASRGVAPEGADSADRKRHLPEKAGIRERRIRHRDLLPDLVVRPHELARGPQARGDAHQRPAEPLLSAGSSRCPRARSRGDRRRRCLAEVVDDRDSPVAEEARLEDEGVGDRGHEHHRRRRCELSRPGVPGRPGAHCRAKLSSASHEFIPDKRGVRDGGRKECPGRIHRRSKGGWRNW